MTPVRKIYVALLILKGFFILLCCIAVGSVIHFLKSAPNERQNKENIYKQWLQIPSNGEGKLHYTLRVTNAGRFINENEFVFGNVNDTCYRREDTYDVYNYHPEDSLFLLQAINSLNIDTSIQKHELKFFLHTSEPTVYSRYCYWQLRYNKLQFDTLYCTETGKAVPHVVNKQLVFTRFPEFDLDYPHHRSEKYEFVYDEKKKCFCPVEMHKTFYFNQKDGKQHPYAVTLFY